MSRWIEAPATLRFSAGSVTLFSVTRPAMVYDEHFLALPSDIPEHDEIPEPLLQGADLAIIRSHPVQRRLPVLKWLARCLRYVPNQYRRHYVDLSGTFDQYLGRFTGKTRSTLSRKIRKFSEFSGGRIEFERFSTAEELARFHSLARRVSAASYQERLLRAGLPDSEQFQEEMAALAAADAVRAYLLLHAGRPIAYQYCPAVGRALLYQHVGFDAEFAQWSPGTILQYLALQDLFKEQKFALLDFTEGEGTHKEFFGTHSRQCADLFYFRRTPRNVALAAAHFGMQAASRRASTLADTLGIKARLKKWLHRV